MRMPLILMFAFMLLPIEHLSAKVKIIGIEIPGLHHLDGASGAYDKIINENVLKSAQATLEVLPPARAVLEFDSCQNCCLSPVNNNPEFYDFVGAFTQTETMNYAKIYVFVKPGFATIDRISDLKDKVVGIRHGISYGKSFDQAHLNVYKVDQLDKLISMINKDHIDVFVSYAPDIFKTFTTLNIAPYPHNVARPIAVHSERMVCRDVDAEFILQFNQRLKQLKDSGELNKILGDSLLVE